MKTILGYSAIFALLDLLCWTFYCWGFYRGECKAKSSEFQWWLRTDKQVEEAREEIWRKEG